MTRQAPTSHEVRQVILETMTGVAQVVVAPVRAAYGRGYVAAFDRATRQAAISKGSRDAPATPGFDVPPTLELDVGDYVQYRELGSDRNVTFPLDRDASASWNPLSAPGQIIVAGEDGAPTVIEPPPDPSLNYALQWDGATQSIVWVELP